MKPALFITTTMLLLTARLEAQTITVAPASAVAGADTELVVSWEGESAKPALGLQLTLRLPEYLSVDADRCVTNPAIARPDSGFAFYPDRGNEFRAMLLALDARVFDPIPVGVELFRCPMHVAESVAEGMTALACRRPAAAVAPVEELTEVPLACVPGWFEVLARSECPGIDDAVRTVRDTLSCRLADF